MDNIRESLGRQGLIRPRDGRVLGGVFAGLGRRFGLEPWPARLQFLIYPLLWLLMPSEDAPAAGPTFSAPPAAA
jgi:phage shock protein C